MIVIATATYTGSLKLKNLGMLEFPSECWSTRNSSAADKINGLTKDKVPQGIRKGEISR